MPITSHQLIIEHLGYSVFVQIDRASWLNPDGAMRVALDLFGKPPMPESAWVQWATPYASCSDTELRSVVHQWLARNGLDALQGAPAEKRA